MGVVTVYWELGQFIGSWESLLRVETVYWELGQFIGSWDSLLGVGTVYWELGQFIESWKSLFPSLRKKVHKECKDSFSVRRRNY